MEEEDYSGIEISRLQEKLDRQTLLIANIADAYVRHEALLLQHCICEVGSGEESKLDKAEKELKRLIDEAFKVRGQS